VSEPYESRPPKVRSVLEGLQDIVAIAGLLVGITSAIFSWTEEGSKGNIVLLGFIVFSFLTSIMVLFTYLRYEKRGNRLNDITGDLTEGYSQVRERHNRIAADAWLLVQVVRLILIGMRSLFRA
jgi:Na+/melibiose symporter-like transporter